MANNGLTREELFRPKLTAKQKNEIFHAYIDLPLGETRGFVKKTAEEYGVSTDTILRIIHDKKRMKRYLDGLNEIRNLALARLVQASPDAVNVAVSIMNDTTLPEHMASTRLNAAESIMRRAGIQHKEADAEANTLNIRFVEGGGFRLGETEDVKVEE